MKKLLVVALAFCTFTAIAQEKKRNWEDYKKEQGLESRKNMTPKDRAQLDSKKMTLQLDLTADQQSKVEAILLTHYKEAKTKRDVMKKAKKPTEEERLAMRNDMLDAQIALKKEMKAVLNAEQYEKYEKMQGRRFQRGTKKMKEGKRRR